MEYFPLLLNLSQCALKPVQPVPSHSQSHRAAMTDLPKEDRTPATLDDEAEMLTIQMLISKDGEIASAKGAHELWLGLTEDAVCGSPVTALVHPDCAILVSEILYRAEMAEELEPITLFLAGTGGAPCGATVTGRSYRRDPGFYHITVVVDPTLDYRARPKDTPAGLVAEVERHLAKGDGANLTLTLVELTGLSDAQERLKLGRDQIDAYRGEIEDALRAAAIEPDAVSQVDEAKYGLVRKGAPEPSDALRARLDALAAERDPDGAVLSVGSKDIALDPGGLDPTAVADSLSHTVATFVSGGLDALIYDTLEDGHVAFLDRRANRTEVLKTALGANAMASAFRPVLLTEQWKAHHFLTEMRAELVDDGLGADEILSLTRDDPGLRALVDRAQTTLVASDDALAGQRVMVRIAIRSLLDPGLISPLLQQAWNSRTQMILAIAGLGPGMVDRITALATLRNAGFQLALHGSEIGAVTEASLARLPADYIILDQSLVADRETLARSLPSLKALAERCAKHGLAVIFDGVTASDSASLLGKLPGALAMGPYYGAPFQTPSACPIPILW